MSNLEFFNRIASLSVVSAENYTSPQGPTQTPSRSILTIKGLHISFEIEKVETVGGNKAKVMVSNLSLASQKKIKANANMLLVLQVGYKDGNGLETILVGTIVDVSHDNSKPDSTTTIEVEDGNGYTKKSRVKVSFGKGAKAISPINSALDSFGVPKKVSAVVTRLLDKTLPTGYSFSGYASDLIDEICDDNNLTWSIQNNEFKIYPKTGTDENAPIKSVLINSPIHKVKKSQNASALDKDFTGWTIDALLMPKVLPGGTITVESKEITPAVTLKVRKVRHTGDTHGDAWMTTIDGELI